MELVKWEAAKRAIIEAHSVDEVAKIRDYAEARRYALKQAGEAPEIIRKAEEIKLRAERRAGQILQDMKSKGEIKSHRPEEVSQDSTLKDLGITRNESSKWQRIAGIPEDRFETYLEVAKEITTSGAIKIAKNVECDDKIKERAERGNKIRDIPNNVKLFCDDFRNVELEKNSIDLILTDPPYPKEFLNLWKPLGEFADKYLKPDGYLITYSGQLYINQVISFLDINLQYCWTMALYHSGSTQLVFPRNVICEWKPILIYRKGQPGKFANTFSDYIVSDKRCKDLHEWQQNDGAPEYIINHFTTPGMVVCDPFAGSGTFLISALNKGCKAIGIDIEKGNVDLIKDRIYDESRDYGKAGFKVQPMDSGKPTG